MLVAVMDENDNAPEFEQKLYGAAVEEGPITLPKLLFTAKAADRDKVKREEHTVMYGKD